LCLGEGPWCWMLQPLIFYVCRCWASMLQTCVVRCCKYYFSMLQTLRFDVCRHVVLGVVLRRMEEAPDVGCCTQHGSQHGNNIVATWSQHGGGEKKHSWCWMLQATAFATFSQHARNIYSVDFRSNGWRLRILRSNGHGPVRCQRPDRTSGR
jgi:hypothetical protein